MTGQRNILIDKFALSKINSRLEKIVLPLRIYAYSNGNTNKLSIKKFCQFQAFKSNINIRALFVNMVLILITSNVAFAQLFSNQNNTTNNFSNEQKILSDTTKKKKIKTDDKIKIITFTLIDTSKKYIDTSISILQQSSFFNPWQIDLGNVGSSQKSLLFSPIMQPNIQFGIESNNAYLFTQEKNKYYNTTRPFTDLFYKIGSKKEQILEFTHTQNVNSRWNIAANYRKIGSLGFYSGQKTNNDNFSITTNFISTNQRYSLIAGIVYNKLQQDENGGIQSDSFLINTYYRNRKLVPTNIDYISYNHSTVTNYYRNVSFLLQHQYFFGRSKYIISEDSIEKTLVFKPIFGIKHKLYSNFIYSRYKDLTPDSLFYLPLQLDYIPNRDSLIAKQFLNTIGNAFSLNGNIHYGSKIVESEAGYGIEIETPHSLHFDKTYFNNYIFASVHKPYSSLYDWRYDALLKLYFLGNARGNFQLNFHAGKSISTLKSIVDIGFEQSIQSAPYLFLLYDANYLQVQQSFLKQTISKAYFNFSQLSSSANFKFNYFVVGNYFYRDTTMLSKQYNKVIPILQGVFSKKIFWKKFVLDNDILLQFSPNGSPIHLPKFATRQRLAHESKFINGKLQTAFGIEFRYNTSFYVDDYSPLYYGFVSQYAQKFINFPHESVFFNFKIKGFRGSIALDELQQLINANTNNYLLYPTQGFMLRFGFHWVFIN